MSNLRDLGIEKYWSPPATWPYSKKKELIDNAIESGLYMASVKIDGNYARVTKEMDGSIHIQSRGEIEGKVKKPSQWEEKVPHIMAALDEILPPGSMIVGELYYDGGDDKSVGSILRSLPPRAIALQEERGKLKFYVFDILRWGDKDLLKTPLNDRIEYLKHLAYGLNSPDKEHPYFTYATYYTAPEYIRILWSETIANGGEGIVLQKCSGVYEPGKRPARKSIKLKQELEALVFCIGTMPSQRPFTGKDIATCQYWENIKTGEKLKGNLILEYEKGVTIEPISKGYYFGWPRGMIAGVYKGDGTIHTIAIIPNLTEELQQDLLYNYDSYHMKVMRVHCMDLYNQHLRHPKFLSWEPTLNHSICMLDRIGE